MSDAERILSWAMLNDLFKETKQENIASGLGLSNHSVFLYHPFQFELAILNHAATT